MFGKTMSFKSIGNGVIKNNKAKIIDRYYHDKLGKDVYVGKTDYGNIVKLTIDEIESIY